VRAARLAALAVELLIRGDDVHRRRRWIAAQLDFVKSDRGGHRGAFLRDAPDLVIVDEAHIAARPRGSDGRVEHQRYELLRDVAKNPSRHVILVTATPHSGIEESFRSRLGLLEGGLEQATDRKKLLPHIIQRRRQGVEKWLGGETPFPDRLAEDRRRNSDSNRRSRHPGASARVRAAPFAMAGR
jgi:hypothetical protein